jgi:hypothetical protein
MSLHLSVLWPFRVSEVAEQERRRVRFINVCRRIICVIAFALFASKANSQFLTVAPPESPRSLSLLGSNVASVNDALSANSACDSTQTVGMSYNPLPLGIEGAWSAAVNACYAIDHNNRIGAAVIANAFQEIYSKQIAMLQYARAIDVSRDTTRSIIAGVRLKYSSEHFGGQYLPLNDLKMDIGFRITLVDRVEAGIAITDLAMIYHNQDVENSDRTTFAGLSWKALDDVSVHCALEAPQNESVSLLVGIECMLDSHVAVRAGAETAIGELAFGAGLHYANLEIDIAALHHPVLGSSLSFGLVYGL